MAVGNDLNLKGYIISYWEIKLEYQEILGEPAGRIPIFNLIF